MVKFKIFTMARKHSTIVHNATSDDLWVEINKSKDLVKVGEYRRFSTDFEDIKIKFGKNRSYLNYEVKDAQINLLQRAFSNNSYIIKEENGIFKIVEAIYGTTSQENRKGVNVLSTFKG